MLQIHTEQLTAIEGEWHSENPRRQPVAAVLTVPAYALIISPTAVIIVLVSIFGDQHQFCSYTHRLDLELIYAQV